jgi:flagellar assembly protein FliH
MSSVRKVLIAPEINDVFVIYGSMETEEPAVAQGVNSATTPAPPPGRPADEAYQRGLKEGLANAQRLADAKCAAFVKSLSAAIESIRRERESLSQAAEEEAVRLALAIASKIIRRECRTSPEAVRQVAHEALQRVPVRDVISIRVNPADKEELEQRWLATLPEDGHKIDIVGDPAIDRGGCLVETKLGTIDGTLESQWREIADSLLKESDELQHA